MPRISGGGAPADIAYLLAAAAADARLPNSVAGGAAPLSELGGTWGAPTVDGTHSGSAHHSNANDHANTQVGHTWHGTVATVDHHSPANDHVNSEAAHTWHTLGIATHPAAAGLTRVGGNLTEATSTSTTVVDLMTVTGLTVGAAVACLYELAFRKTSGAVATVGFGMKLNTTVVSEALNSANDIQNVCGGFSTTNDNYHGLAHGIIKSISGNHTFGGVIGEYGFWNSAGSYVTAGNRINTTSVSGNRPNATLTDVIVRFISGSALVTGGADELNIYSMNNA